MTGEAAPLTAGELRQLRALLDRDSIQRVIEGYARGMDRCEEASARAAYWDDAQDERGTLKGSGQDFVTLALDASPTQVSGHQHVLGQSVINVDGDSASAETYFVYYGEQARAPEPNVVSVLGARYVDAFERRGAEWKVIDRVVVVDWSTVWRSDERFPGVEAFISGDWYPNDMVYQRLHSPT